MSTTRRIRTSRPRTIGWGGHWWEEQQWPGWLYYPSRTLWRLAVAHPVLATCLAVLGVLWLVGGAVGLAVFILGTCLFVAYRLGWLSKIAGRDLHPKDLLDDLPGDAKQRATLMKQWGIACESTRLLGTRSGQPPRLHAWQVHGDGSGTLTVDVKCGPIGIPPSDFAKQADRLRQVIGCREVIVTERDSGTARLTLHWRDPIRRALPLAAMPVPPRTDGLVRLAYGIRQDGTPALINALQSVLIGGLTRKGKSNWVWASLASALMQGIPVDLYASDPKGGVELDQLEHAMEAALEQGFKSTGLQRGGRLLHVRRYAKNTEETIEMVDAALAAMTLRQKHMKKAGTRQIRPDMENPLVIVILDETLPLTDILRRGTDSSLGKIAYTGAAAAYVVWANTQVAQIDSIGRFRDLIPQRICFATNSSDVTDSVLGKGAEAMGARCSDINEAGIGYSYSEGDKTFRKFRAAKVTDDETRAIASGVLPAKILNAAREAFDRAEEEQASSSSGRSRKNRRTALYRWYYVDSPEYGDSLGYVGISYDVLGREAQHDANLRAFMDGNVRREVVWYETRSEAEAAEEHAIKTEKPIWNKQHNGGNPRRRRDKVSQ